MDRAVRGRAQQEPSAPPSTRIRSPRRRTGRLGTRHIGWDGLYAKMLDYFWTHIFLNKNTPPSSPRSEKKGGILIKISTDWGAPERRKIDENTPDFFLS